ncbi:MAG: cyclase family protein [Myxococcales bacterium]|nr:cyclase family protein [Myxococcales bacterium]
MSSQMGQVTIQFQSLCVSVDLRRPIEIGIPLDFQGDQPQAFYLPRAEAAAFAAGSFVGDTRQGGSVNCFCLQLAPHGNGTHTECVGHIAKERIWVHSILQQSFFLACVLRVPLSRLDASGESYAAPHTPADRVITAAALQRAWEELGCDVKESIAWVIQTTDDLSDPQGRVYSGQNPPYLTDQAMDWLLQHDPLHLLVDVPSVDREEDAGILPNHHRFWGLALGDSHLNGEPSKRTITEMIQVPSHLVGGLYILEIQIPAFLQDAAPSRPRLYEITSSNEQG